MTYEYQVIPTPPRRDTLYQLLNTLGAQGWRYVGEHAGHLVFERATEAPYNPAGRKYHPDSPPPPSAP